MKMLSIGRDIPHDSAVTHVAGQSAFLDDFAPLSGELIAGIVPSPVAHGRLSDLDVSAARGIPGVAAVLTARDIPGHNHFGATAADELLIVDDVAYFLGQPLAIIAAETPAALEQAKGAVMARLDPMTPIFTVDLAIAANSFLGEPRRIERGDIATALANSPHRLTSELNIGGQEHFYLESQAALAVPGEQSAMTVHSSTQHPSEVQAMVAEVLNIPFNRVTCICKRMGGGFGGKETQAAQPAMMAALLAAATQHPVRFVYNKDDDMRFTGKRHPFKAIYTVGFDDDGRILALDIQLFSNGGCSTDLSAAVLERAILHADNAYFIPNIRVVGRICRTNLPSNTAFRGFGAPQAVASIENIVQEIAIALGRDAVDVRMLNCYGGSPRDVTPYGQTVRNNTLPELFAGLRRDCEYDRRREEIRRFNSQSPTQLRGLALSAVKFGISFTRKTMNQANAMVNIYMDGSVIVSTGATEMGQGVNTRVRQIVADELGVNYDRVLVTATNTDKNNNTSPTAASAGTDLNGAAAADACRRLRARLTEIAASMLGGAATKSAFSPDAVHIHFESDKVFDDRAPTNAIPFAKVVAVAYEQRVSLGERGFYATPGIEYDRAAGRGTPFLYYTCGVAASEVLIDRLTGETKVLRADLLMDIGKSINPGIDRGQTVGAFIQGLGWVTTEELVYADDGQLLSHSPTTYKIPAASDLPESFSVRYIDNPDSDVSFYRSKAVGEPPLLLGISVWLAIKDALASAAIAAGLPCPALSIPATGERILLALESARANRSAIAPVPT